MKVVLLFTSLFFSTVLLAQKKGDIHYRQPYVAGVRVDSIDAQYIQVETLPYDGYAYIFSKGVSRRNQAVIKDQLGSEIQFPTVADLLNTMAENGWVYVDALPSQRETVILILRKKQ